MRKTYLIIAGFISIIMIIVACSKTQPVGPAEDELLDGPLEGLNNAQSAQFLAGDAAFSDEVFNSTKGLGPIFVAANCASCHVGEGKGTPFTTLTRFGQFDSTGNQFLHLGGPQLQNRALPGFTPEQIPAGATFSRFTPPANTGLGFVSLVPEADILAMADPNDANGDGISGVANWNEVPGYVNIPANAITRNGKYLCRFGKKASVFDILQQTVSAYNQDMGITSTFDPVDVYSGLTIDPEVPDNTIRNVVAYLTTLKVPAQRTPTAPDVIEGKNIFMRTGCEGCHKQTLKTGFSTIEALSNKEFHPYSDLLMHDMGQALDDGYTEGTAKTAEWRTPLLWGLGLSTDAQGGRFFLLHDGRASSIEQAIEMHGGEGTNAKNKYTQLNASEKNNLIKFLKSL